MADKAQSAGRSTIDVGLHFSPEAYDIDLIMFQNLATLQCNTFQLQASPPPTLFLSSERLSVLGDILC